MRRFVVLLALLLAACSNSKPIKKPVIPPPVSATVIHFSTYLGNDLADVVRDIAMDSTGNVYAVGGALSANLLPGTPVSAFGGGEDAFVAKFDGAGAVVWWTFLGGPGPDRGYAIEIDADDNVVIGGGAANLFPVTAGAVLTQFQGGAGTCDPNQLASAGTPPAPAGAVCVVDTTNPARDGFVAKLDGATGALLWATYFGSGKFEADSYLDGAGTADDNVTDFNDDADPRTSIVRDIAVDPLTRDIYLTFSVRGPTARFDLDQSATTIEPIIRNLPGVILSALQNGDRPTLPGLDTAGSSGIDGILAKLAPDGATLAWATYVGGTGDESDASSVRLDSSGNPIVLYSTASVKRVLTQSATFIVLTDEVITKNAFDATLGGSDFYLAKYPMNGGPMIWATYLGEVGGEGVESANFAIRPDQSIAVAGVSNSLVLGPVVPGFDPTFNGVGGGGFYSADCAVALLSPTANQLLAASFYGGASGDGCTGVAADSQGRVYVTGGSSSTDLPLRGGPHQSLLPGPRSAFLAVFSADLTTLLQGGYFGGTGLGNSNALLIRSDTATNARVVIAGEAGAAYPLTPSPGTPARGSVTAPPAHGVVSDLTIQLAP